MRIGLIAEKIGMTQIFDESGLQIPVTVLKIDPCTVLNVKTKEKDGYDSVQLGAKEVSEKKVNKPQLGFFKKIGLGPFKVLKEFRIDESSSLSVGDVIDVNHFAAGQLIDVTGVSVGKGFAGAMKKYGFGGLRATHGVSITHRCHGSTGNRTLPGRVFKNKKMAGHMGAEKVTTLNLKVHSVDAEKGVILVRGCVPGSKSGIVFVRDAIKVK